MPIKTIIKMNKAERPLSRRSQWRWDRWGAAVVMVAALVMSSVPGTARADERDHWRGDDRDHWRGDERDHWRGDYPRFHEFDLDRWRSAQWWHGWHDGRDGWWWVVSGIWYWYPAPIYPYPDPYRPPVVTVPGGPAAGPLWYYCRNPQGYYPYVATCAGPWEPVTPTPGPR